MNSWNIEKICVLMCFLGVSVLWAYLNLVRLNTDVPFEILVTAVFLCSSALTTSYLRTSKRKISAYSLVILYLVSYGMLTIYSFRYDLFGGSDVIGEYVIASKTLHLRRWPIGSLDIGWGDRAGRYASCLSVTIFPAILSTVSGIRMLDLFKFILPAICAFVPLLLYLIVDDVFQDKRVAFLSATLFAISHLQIFLLSYLFREQIANFFLLLSIYTILKFHKNLGVATLALLGVIFSNAGHATADFSFLLLVAFLVTPLLLRIRGRKNEVLLSWKLPTFYAAATVLWLFFFANPLFVQHYSVLGGTLTDFVRYFPEYMSKVLATGNIFPSQSLVGSGLPVSVLLKLWYYLSVILVLFGWLFAAIKFNNDPKKLSLTAYCFLMFSLFTFTTFAPGLIPELGAARVFADPFFPLFTGVALSIPCFLSEKKYLKYGRYIAVLTIVFLFLSLPMNLNLVDYERILHFNSENTLVPQIRAVYFDVSFSDLTFAEWIVEYIPSDSWIAVDQRGFNTAYLADHVNKTYMTYPAYSDLSDFLILHSLYIENGIWITPYHTSVFPSQNITWQDIALQTLIVYNDGTMVLAAKISNETS